jgi:23S rRNA (pseudouridine1915-N3)-methyltransferase
MRIHLLAVGTRMPVWVKQGYLEYAGRMPKECALVLQEIPPAKRVKGVAVTQQIEQESTRLLAAIPRNSYVVALDLRGHQWSTEKLASKLSGWLQSGKTLTLMIGGPDGLSKNCLQRADYRWSLSALTFPHPLVRVMVAEQLFRAWSIIRNHPYHRA